MDGRKRRDRGLLALGMLGVLILQGLAIPINGEILFPIHDQLDGEILTYILKAHAPFSASIPQLFNGTSASSMTPPAILFTIPYMFCSPAIAFYINYLIILLVAYTGMYICVKKLLDSSWIAVVTGFLFSLLPFYSVYGLSVMGQPLLVYSFYRLWNAGKAKPEREKRNNDVVPYVLIVLFALSSSLVLVGFADLVLLTLISLYGLLKRRDMKAFYVGILLLLSVYCLSNISLIADVFGKRGFTSHKIEYIAAESNLPALEVAQQMFKEGYYHAASNHQKIIAIAEGMLLIALVFWEKYDAEDKTNVIQMGLLCILAFLIAGFYALWHSNRIVSFRNNVGGLLVEFQFDRFYWLYPVIWFLLLAYSLYFLWKLVQEGNWLKYIPLIIVTITVFYNLWENSDLKINWDAKKKGIVPSSYSSVDSFFQKKIFDEIDEYIFYRTGKQKEEYRVISVGLYPSIALYNGFYCLDGYSNNYDVRYKHEFREIIAGELEKNLTLRNYYDTWGNRVYAFSSEIPSVYYPSKTTDKKIEHLDFDFRKLFDLGCKYIFSAVPIENCERLKLLKSFETENSYYRIFLYKMIPE